MSYNLIIERQYRDDIKQIVQALNPKFSDYCVSFCILPKQNELLIIGGCSPNYIQKRLPLAVGHELKKMQFTLDGDFFSQLLTYSTYHISSDKNKNQSVSEAELDFYEKIHLELETEKKQDLKIYLISNTGKSRGCESVAFLEAHKTFIKENEQHTFQSARVPAIQRLLLEVDTYTPFQFINIDKEKREMCVQSDNNIVEHSIPEHIDIPISLALTQDAANMLSEICEQTKDDEIEIALHGENITLKTNKTTKTISLAGLEEFYKSKPVQYEEVVTMFVNIQSFKDVINESHNKYHKIRREDKNHLLLEENELNIVNIVSIYDFDTPIDAKGFFVKEPQVYLTHLKDIKAIKIKDLTETDEAKIAILKGPQGEYKLGFYKQGNDKYPHDSVLIEPVPQDLDKVMAVKKKAQARKAAKNMWETKGETNTEDRSDPQGDLWGFDL